MTEKKLWTPDGEVPVEDANGTNFDINKEAAEELAGAGPNEELVEEFEQYARKISQELHQKLINHIEDGELRTAALLPYMVVDQILFDFVSSATSARERKARAKAMVKYIKDSAHRAQIAR